MSRERMRSHAMVMLLVPHVVRRQWSWLQLEMLTRSKQRRRKLTDASQANLAHSASVSGGRRKAALQGSDPNWEAYDLEAPIRAPASETSNSRT